MSITININDGQVVATPPQATATSTTAAADQSAGPNALLAEATASMPVHAPTEVRAAGGPSAALIQEVELALGQLAETARVAANQDGINAGSSPV